MTARDELLTFAARLDQSAELAAANGNAQLEQDFRARAALLRAQVQLRRAASPRGRPQVATA